MLNRIDVENDPVNWIDPDGLQISDTKAFLLLRFLQGWNTLSPIPLPPHPDPLVRPYLTPNPIASALAILLTNPTPIGGKPKTDCNGKKHYQDEISYWQLPEKLCCND